MMIAEVQQLKVMVIQMTPEDANALINESANGQTHFEALRQELYRAVNR